MRKIINELKNFVILLIVSFWGNGLSDNDNDGYNNC